MSQWIMKRRLRRPLGMLGGALLAMAVFSSAAAQEAPTTEDQITDLVTAIDTAWLLVTASMVFFMQAGFAMVESGFIRAKNTSNVLMKNMLDACVGGLFFWAFGYAIAFGVSGIGEVEVSIREDKALDAMLAKAKITEVTAEQLAAERAEKAKLEERLAALRGK